MLYAVSLLPNGALPRSPLFLDRFLLRFTRIVSISQRFIIKQNPFIGLLVMSLPSGSCYSLFLLSFLKYLYLTYESTSLNLLCHLMRESFVFPPPFIFHDWLSLECNLDFPGRLESLWVRSFACGFANFSQESFLCLPLFSSVEPTFIHRGAHPI